MVKFVWFDLGNTLVHVKKEKAYQQKLQAYQIQRTIPEIALAFHLADKTFMRDFPGLLGKGYEQYAEKYFHTLHTFLNIDPNKLPGNFIEPEHPKQPKGKWEAFPSTLQTLENLKEQGIRIGLISNWNDTARTVLDDTQLTSYFEKIIISSEVGMEKPDQRIFEIALDAIDIPADECIYVGDNYYDDVVGSKQVGMDSILINAFGKKGIEEIHHPFIISNISELLTMLPSVEKSPTM